MQNIHVNHGNTGLAGYRSATNLSGTAKRHTRSCWVGCCSLRRAGCCNLWYATPIHPLIPAGLQAKYTKCTRNPRYTTMGPHYFFLATSPFESTGKSHGLQLSQHNLPLAAAASNHCWLLQPDARNDTRKHMRFYRPTGKIIRIFGLITAK